MHETTNFKEHEFKCPCCGECDMEARLIDGLQDARDAMNALNDRGGISGIFGIQINSGYRCINHNKKVGGSNTSSHLWGFAADLACKESVYRRKLIIALLPRFKRIGIADTFIHIDCDSTKPQNVVWVYKS